MCSLIYISYNIIAKKESEVKMKCIDCWRLKISWNTMYINSGNSLTNRQRIDIDDNHDTSHDRAILLRFYGSFLSIGEVSCEKHDL